MRRQKRQPDKILRPHLGFGICSITIYLAWSCQRCSRLQIPESFSCVLGPKDTSTHLLSFSPSFTHRYSLQIQGSQHPLFSSLFVGFFSPNKSYLLLFGCRTPAGTAIFTVTAWNVSVCSVTQQRASKSFKGSGLVLQQPLSTLTDPFYTAYGLTRGYSFQKRRALWLTFNPSGFRNLLSIFPGHSLKRILILITSALSETSQSTCPILFPFQLHVQKGRSLRTHICCYQLLIKEKAFFLVPYSCFIKKKKLHNAKKKNQIYFTKDLQLFSRDLISLINASRQVRN